MMKPKPKPKKRGPYKKTPKVPKKTEKPKDKCAMCGSGGLLSVTAEGDGPYCAACWTMCSDRVCSR